MDCANLGSCYYRHMAEDKKKKVLLVEDDIFMADLLTREFAQAGLEIVLAKTGQEAVDKFSAARPDIILLDILLPDVNGLEVLRQIRRKDGGPETKVLILSNLSSERDIEDANRLAVVGYLVKANTSLPEIVEKIKSLVEVEPALPPTVQEKPNG